jgi:uncharacterized membrane protein
MFAKTVYFFPAVTPILVQVNSFQRRLCLRYGTILAYVLRYCSELDRFSDVAVHLLAVILIVIGVAGMFAQIFHRRSRQQLRLQHIPGTIASAISFRAGHNLVQMLTNEKDDNALRDALFRIDPRTMQILMEGDEGYEAVNPNPRQSISPS